ncbi:MAG: hypothetical protein ABJA87_00115 [bacterium]
MERSLTQGRPTALLSERTTAPTSPTDQPCASRRLLPTLAVTAAGTVATVLCRLPGPLGIVAVVVGLAGLDLVGAVLAKSWATAASPLTFLGGASVFVVLFWLYATSLRAGELSVVTLGWVVVVTVGALVLDRFRYGVHLSGSQWVAAGVAVVALAYLLLDAPA